MRLLIPMAAALICSSEMGAVAASRPRVDVQSSQRAAGADDAAFVAVRQATEAFKSVTFDRSQSFRILNRKNNIANLVAGKGQAPGAVYMGCFIALVEGGRTTVVPTIGSGDWEAETCGRAMATGLIATGDATLIAVVYEATSPNALVREPVVLRWNRKDRTLVADEALSRRASISGATSIAAMRRLLR